MHRHDTKAGNITSCPSTIANLNRLAEARKKEKAAAAAEAAAVTTKAFTCSRQIVFLQIGQLSLQGSRLGSSHWSYTALFEGLGRCQLIIIRGCYVLQAVRDITCLSSYGARAPCLH